MVTLEELKAMVLTLQKKIDKLENAGKWEPRGNYRIKLLKEDAPTMLTIEAAKKASDAMRTHNRLLAYVDEFGGNWEADWEDNLELNYCVQYSNHSKKWGVDGRYMACVSGTVYMSRECAEGLAAKLNSGEVVL